MSLHSFTDGITRVQQSALMDEKRRESIELS